MIVKQIDFDTIKDIWKNELWENRQSEIKATSSMVFNGGYDMSIHNNVPTFLCVENENQIVAVNSGHMTINNFYRSRGLWVKQEFRKKGITYLLFDVLMKQALKEGAKFIWSLPRSSSLSVYLKNGFVCESNPVYNFEFGPHFYVSKKLV